MEPRLDPSARLGTALLAALQGQPGDARLQALLGFVGESLDLVLLTNEGGTARLQMASGQVIEAKGDVPYPPGTRLTVQVLAPEPGQQAPRLKLVEAVPPPPLTILAPLQQGEALQLLARLSLPETPPALAALARLFEALGAEGRARAADSGPVPTRENPEGATRATGVAERPAGSPTPLPAERVVAVLKTLPPAALRDLQRIIFPRATPSPSLPETAEALQRLLRALEQDTAAQAAPPPAPAGSRTAPEGRPPDPAREKLPAAAQDLLQRLEHALATGAPPAAGTARGADPALDGLQAFLLRLLRTSEPPVRTDPPAATKPAPTAAGPTSPLHAEQATPQAPAAGLQPVPEPPSRERLQTLLKELPPVVLRDLQRLLFPTASKPPSLQETTDGLQRLLQAAGSGQPEAAAQLAKAQQVLAAPAPAADPAVQSLRTLLVQNDPVAPTSERLQTLLKELPPVVLRDLQRLLFPTASNSPSLQETADGLQRLLQAAGSGQPEAAAQLAKVQQVLAAPAPAADPAVQTLRNLLVPSDPTPPSSERLQALLKELPPVVLRDLQRLLFPTASKPPSLQETADGLQRLLQAAGSGQPVAAAQLAKVQQVLAAPAPAADPAVQTLRNLLLQSEPVAPSSERLQALLKELPPAVLRDLQRLLFPTASKPPSLQETADGLQRLLQAAGSGQPEAAAQLAKVQQVLAAPAPAADPAVQSLRNLLVQNDPVAPTSERLQALLKELPPAVLRDLQRLLFPTASNSPSLQETADGLQRLLQAAGSGQPEAAAQLAKVQQVLAAPAPAADPAVQSLRNLLVQNDPVAPTSERLQALLKELPPAVLRDLQRLLFPTASKPPSLQETADGLQRLLPAAGSGQPEAAAQLAKVQQVLAAPAPAADPAVQSLRNLLLQSEPVAPSSERLQTLLKELPPAVLRDLQLLLFPTASKPPSLQETADGLQRLLQAAGSGQPEAAAQLAKVQQVLAAPAPAADPAVQSLRNLLLQSEPVAPSSERLQTLLKELPPAVLRDLQRLLFPGSLKPVLVPDLAEALRTLLGAAEPRQGAGSPAPVDAALGLKNLQAVLSPAASVLPTSVRPTLEALQQRLQFLLQPTAPGPGSERVLAPPGPTEPVGIDGPDTPLPPSVPGNAVKGTTPAVSEALWALPSTGRVAALLRDLPRATLLEYQGILLPGTAAPATLPELAEAIRGLLRVLTPDAGATGQPTSRPSLAAIPAPPSAGPGSLPAGSRTGLEPLADLLRPGALGNGAAGAGPAALSPAGSSGGRGTLTAEFLQQIQRAASLPAPTLPTLAFLGGGDPALEPLKNLLMVLLRPSFGAETASPAPADLLAQAAARPQEAALPHRPSASGLPPSAPVPSGEPPRSPAAPSVPPPVRPNPWARKRLPPARPPPSLRPWWRNHGNPG